QIRRRLIAVAGMLLAIILTADSEAGLLKTKVTEKVTQLIDLLRDESATEYEEVECLAALGTKEVYDACDSAIPLRHERTAARWRLHSHPGHPARRQATPAGTLRAIEQPFGLFSLFPVLTSDDS